MMLFRPHAVCEGRGCHLCSSVGFVASGVTTEIVDDLRKRLHEARNELQAEQARRILAGMERCESS